MRAGKLSLGLDFIGKMKVHGFFIPLSDGFIDQTRPMLPAGFTAQPMAGYSPQVKAGRAYWIYAGEQAIYRLKGNTWSMI